MILLTTDTPAFDFQPLLLSPSPVRFFTTGPKFDVNGVEMSRDEILALDPAQRTVAHWLVIVDWDLQRQRPYVIIDPYDPSGLLYLNSAEYLLQTRTLASANVPFIVICRPDTTRPAPTKTPPLSEDRVGCVDAVYGYPRRKTRAHGRFQAYRALPLGLEGEIPIDWSQTTWKHFSDLRKWISKNCPWGKGGTVKVNDRNVMGLVMMWHRELLHYLDVKSPGRRTEQINPFVQHLQTLLRHNGPAFTIQRLKVSLFVLYSYVGGNPVTSSQMTELGHRIRLRGGLPAFLDKGVRDSLRRGQPNTVRLYASLFNIYKVLWGPHGRSPLSTITAPPYTGDIGDFSSFARDCEDGFFARWENHIDSRLPGWEYKSQHGYLIASAGANASCAMQSIYRDALAWSATGVANYPLEWFQLWGDTKMSEFMVSVQKEASEWAFNVDQKPNSLLATPWEKGPGIDRINSEFLRLLGRIETDEYATRPTNDYLLKLAELAKTHKLLSAGKDAYRNEDGTYTDTFFDSWYAALQHFVRVGVHPNRFSYGVPITGRLHSIAEPAGKVRVVAICDYFTQVGLKPLHEYIFKLLKCNPNDATFGQQEAVDSFAAKGYKEIFSYDLKAATDLIPVQIYTEVLEPLIGRRGADLWTRLLSDRTFLAPKDLRKEGTEWVRYSRGQPMGALSSWACLALGHHALVQFAAKRAGFAGWFSMYLVLGDDIVIADRLVAEAYLAVCAEFGIKVGLAKSLISQKGLMNFASQTLLGQDNLSPISLGEELVALNWSRRKELANRINHRYGTGTESKAEMLALRRALTVNQWSALQGELMGNGGWKTRFVRFILQNPFTSVSEENRVYIERVVDWLGLLSPELLQLSRTSLDSLHREIQRALWDDLTGTLRKKRQEYKEAIAASISVVNSSRYSTFESGTVLWRYLSGALTDHFRTIRSEKLEPLEDKVASHDSSLPDVSVICDYWVELSKIPPVTSAFGDGPRENVFSVIKGQEVSETFGGAPAALRVGKLGAVQGRLPAPPVPKETLRAPFQALLLAVARALGAALPVFSMLSKPVSSGFGRVLSESIRTFESSRVDRDASVPWSSSPLVPVKVPVLVPECMALVLVEDDD